MNFLLISLQFIDLMPTIVSFETSFLQKRKKEKIAKKQRKNKVTVKPHNLKNLTYPNRIITFWT